MFSLRPDSAKQHAQGSSDTAFGQRVVEQNLPMVWAPSVLGADVGRAGRAGRHLGNIPARAPLLRSSDAGGAGGLVHAGVSGFEPDGDVRRADAGVLGLGGRVVG